MQTQTLSAIISWPSKRPVDCADPSWQQTYRFTHALRAEKDDGEPRIYYGTTKDDAARYADGLVKARYQQVHVSKVVYENV